MKVRQIKIWIPFLIFSLFFKALLSGPAIGVDQNVLNKWKNAVIHVEGIVGYGIFQDWMKKNPNLEIPIMNRLKQKLNTGEISQDKYDAAIKGKYALYDIFVKDLRKRGTAVFIEHENRLFLVTARHVIEDELTKQTYHLLLFPFRYDVILSNAKNPIPRLMLPSYILHPELDLAIISLDTDPAQSMGLKLSDIFFKLGYSPINSSEIANEPSSEGAKIFTVGYLQITSIIGYMKPHISYHWDSDVVAEPTFAFGRISLLHPKLPYFWCDLSAYPGHSGSPVVENGKLVGIVSGQANVEGTGRIPFSSVIKAKYIHELTGQKD